MTGTGRRFLIAALAAELSELVKDAEPGHCVRIDDIEDSVAAEIAATLAGPLAPGVDVSVLRSTPRGKGEIAPERAIELRNRKGAAILLLVPAGQGHAASSLDNSFRRLATIDLYRRSEERLLAQIGREQARDLARRYRRHLAPQHREAWVEFLAELAADPSIQAFGRNLWRVGLIPDLGPDLESRLEQNRIAARAISRPTRPAASIDERLTYAGLEDGSWRGSLRRYLDNLGAVLTNPRDWAEGLVAANLTFDHWQFAATVHRDLVSLVVEPFRKIDGSVDKSSKLELGADGQLILRVSEGGAPIVVKWRTEPRNVDSVAKWRLEVRQPSDLRTEDEEPLATRQVKGALRRATIKVEAEADTLEHGSRFVVSVIPIGEHGEELLLETDESADVDSEEFQVVLDGGTSSKLRRAAAPSVPEAVLRAVLAGQDDLTEDLVSWDLDGQVFGLRLGNRRAIQVRVSDLLVRMQRAAVTSPRVAKHYELTGEFGVRLEDCGEGVELEQLPRALRTARAEFLAILGADKQRNTAESVAWNEPLREAARAYAASYRRALDAASGEALQQLLLLETVSLRVRRANTDVRAVIVLPIHPLRITWIAEHDAVLRTWAEQLVEVKPNGARPARLDASLVEQVVAANLPFAVVHANDEIAVYAEELTFGSGLYLTPGDIDRDSAAESICSVLGLDRATSTMRATSAMVAERFRAYEAAHDPGESLRILAVNPGSGELTAGALTENMQQVEPEDGTEPDEPHRLEVIAYSDSAAYVRPVPALADLQRRLRERESTRHSTFLAPPMSLSVRRVEAALEDPKFAHLVVIQDVYDSSVAFESPQERRAPFRELLVPIVTRAFGSGGNSAYWVSGPAVGAGGELAGAHRAHQRAVARRFGRDDSHVPMVQAVLDGDRRALIKAIHRRSDWVVNLDRYVGVDLFSEGVLEQFILDYAPDFVEGIGDRLTVTTTHRREVERLLESAMSDLGLAEVSESVGEVLTTLSVVSGRLALRLLENTTQAREAVSLAALVAYLRNRGELEDLIVVPVDAHPEIFGAAVRDGESARRCDLLLVKVGQRSFKIECVEVKSRKEARLPQALADMIVEQLDDTKRLLESRFFSDPPRIDAELQRARLTSLLHYYADRSARHGLISKIEDVHKYIDRIDEPRERAEITTRGYVISLDGSHGFKKKYGETPMTVLTAQDLASLGFTTRVAELDREMDVAGANDDGNDMPLVSSAGATADDFEGGGPTLDVPVLSPIDTMPEAAGAGDAQPFANTGEDLSDPTTHGVETEAAELAASQGEVVVTLGEDSGGVPVTWTVSTKGSPHAFILGIPGQGKSVSTRKVIRDFELSGLPSMVFDFHGDMAAEPPAGALVLNAAEGLPFNPFEPDVSAGRPINTTAWEIAEILAHVAGLGDIQRNHVYKALQQAYGARGWTALNQGDGTPTMAEFVSALENVEATAAGKNAAARLQPFTDFGLFADDTNERFEILTSERNGWVIDVSQLMEEVQRVAASFILRRVYREMFRWGQDGTMKLAVVLDEAHRMAKDVTLPKIMKEGRKYGAGVIVASQNVDDFHKDVLGNAGTKIVFRTNFPASKAVSGFLRGRTGIDLSQEIEKLNVGVAYVSTPDVAQARKVYMRER
ncbi:helicase HerA domain-containing protein [Oerskovia paurometabola]|uniref:helicase HerA domain-containing protein n=1 Tax=Oerskovia paurometabola TaxID=162170 RepID=UPI0037F52733